MLPWSVCCLLRLIFIGLQFRIYLPWLPICLHYFPHVSTLFSFLFLSFMFIFLSFLSLLFFLFVFVFGQRVAGQVGDWRRHFTVEQSEVFDMKLASKLGHLAIPFRYELPQQPNAQPWRKSPNRCRKLPRARNSHVHLCTFTQRRGREEGGTDTKYWQKTWLFLTVT